MKTISAKRHILFWLVTWGACLYLFRDSLHAYFFQDDWFSLGISRASNVGQFFNFFIPRNDVIYYRPLGMQLPFFLSQTFFGLNPLPFRLATFTIHFVNGYLVYRLVLFILKDKRLAYVAAFFYTTATFNLIVFYWAATFAFVLAPLAYFASFLLYLRQKSTQSLVVFSLGLLANELLLTLPLLICIWELCKGKTGKISKIIPYWIVVALYTVIRFHKAAVSVVGNYSVTFNLINIARNLRDYLLWSVNFPEEMKKQFVTFFWLNPEFVKNFGMYLVIFISASITLIAIFWVVPMGKLLTQIRRKPIPMPEIKLIIFGFVWFIVGLTPVILFIDHEYGYYLPISWVGMLVASLTMFKLFISRSHISNRRINLYLGVILFVWYLSALTNIQFNRIYHWAPKRSQAARDLIGKISKKYPVLPHGAVVVFPGNGDNSDTNRWALGDMNALRVVYNDPAIHTYFSSRDVVLRTLPEIDKQGIGKRLIVLE